MTSRQALTCISKLYLINQNFKVTLPQHAAKSQLIHLTLSLTRLRPQGPEDLDELTMLGGSSIPPLLLSVSESDDCGNEHRHCKQTLGANSSFRLCHPPWVIGNPLLVEETGLLHHHWCPNHFLTKELRPQYGLEAVSLDDLPQPELLNRYYKMRRKTETS